LNEAYERYAQPSFIDLDPIHIPRSFARRADAEVIGFLTATIAWGQRVTIINNAKKLVQLMDETPHDFVMNATDSELDRLAPFIHRTFNGIDLRHFVLGLRHLYNTYGGLENAFLPEANGASSREPRAGASKLKARSSWLASEGIPLFKQRFFEPTHEATHEKTCRRSRQGQQCQTHQHVPALDGAPQRPRRGPRPVEEDQHLPT
jgi:uncharacterized protein (TIGR02757 family)